MVLIFWEWVGDCVLRGEHVGGVGFEEDSIRWELEEGMQEFGFARVQDVA